ncbi:MAG TPA: cation transporter [Firmicutes bacterium]|nr:cation transporter [Bacillota bacterium]
MDTYNAEDTKRQRTLLASMLLSMWAPVATGVAMFLSGSVTQIADFIRRTVEFFALFLSWFVFRALARRRDLTDTVREKWESIVNKVIAAALGISGITMFLLGLFRLGTVQAGGNVTLGLAVALLGLAVNFWFWRRYTKLGKAGPSLIITAQRQLYLAKVVVDLCVIAALSVVAFWPAHRVSVYIDSAGSLAVGAYLLWSGFRTWAAPKKDTDTAQPE